MCRDSDKVERAGLAAAVEQAADAIVITDIEGTIRYVNPAFATLTGYSSEEAVGQHTRILKSGCQAAGVYRELWNTIRSGQIWHGQVINRRKDGTLYPEEMRITPVRSENGEIESYIAIKHDVTSRNAAEKAQGFLAAIVESSDDAICSVGLDGTMVSWNHGAEVLFGYSSQEILGANAAILAPPGSGPEVERSLAAVASGRKISAFDTVLQGKEGRRIDVSLSISPIRNQTGEVVGASATARNISQSLLAKRKIEESEERFRGVFEHAPSGVYVGRLDGHLQQMNTAFCGMLGYSEDELLSKTWQELTHPDDLGPALLRWEQLWQDADGCRDAEMRYIHRAGNLVWGRVRISAVRDSRGDPLYYVIHVEDITAHKRAEEALRESEERFRVMADSCPTMLWVTNAQGGVQFINSQYREFCGITMEQVDGQQWTLLLHPDDAPDYLTILQSATREHTPFRAEARIRRADGEWRLIGSNAEPRWSSGGEFLGHIGLSADITDRRQSEQALRTSEEKFRQLAENIREVFWMMPPEANKILYVSPAYEQVWGRSCASVYQNPMSWAEAIHPDDAERVRVLFGTRIQGEAADSEYRIRTPQGQEKWIRDRAFPVRGADGQLIRIVGIAEEITEQKRHKEELIHAGEAADAANRAKSRFLANVSHEIRTPMNGVLGMLQLIGDTDLTSEQRRFISVAMTSGRALLELIDGILDLSKIEAQKITLENLSFNLHHTIAEIAEPLRVQANTKGLRFHSRLAPDTPEFLVGDAHRLRQVLTNLVGNAIKFTERGEVTLYTALESQGDGTATVRFAIADTGIGIRPEQVAVLFSPFVQADASMTRRYGGTGLGLAICKHLVEMMEGTIGLDTEEGHGSTFWFTALFGLASASPELLPSAPNNQQTSEPSRGIKADARILLAEDNSTNREVVLAQLKKLGYRANAVTNGAEAIDALQQAEAPQDRYDLVLMDCQMPVMDGFEATRHIRESIQPGIPIVAVTADAMSGDRDRCLSKGMNDYISKPVDLMKLAETLARWLPGSESGEAAHIPDCRAAAVLNTEAVFNQEALLSRLMADRQLAGSILNGFLQDVPSQLNNLWTLLDERDALALRRQAHTLKGAAATVSAERLRATALKMEQSSASADFDQCGELMPQLAGEFERFKSTLELAGWVQTQTPVLFKDDTR